MKSELYRPQGSVAINSRVHLEIQGEEVPNANVPFKDGDIRLFSQASILPRQGKVLPHQRKDLIQISPSHGRSYQINLGHNPHLFFSDEFGNIYSTVITKGNNLQKVRARKSEQAPSGFAVLGLHESDSMVRVLRASALMRRAGIDTELIFKVLEPTEFPFQPEIIPAPEIKRKLVEDIWIGDSPDRQGVRVEKEDIANLSRYLEDTTFFIIIRGMQVAERLIDLNHCQTKKEFLELMTRVFNYINRVQESRGSQKRFDAAKTDDIIDYFTDYLPTRIATNIAKIHNLGLMHHYATDHNINLAGALVDLDSVTGPKLELGDKEHAQEDFVDEAEKILTYIASHEDVSTRLGPFVKVDEQNVQEIKKNFIKTYIKERGWGEDLIGNAPGIFNLLQSDPTRDETSLWNYYASLLKQKLGLELVDAESVAAIMRTLGESDKWNADNILQSIIQAEEDFAKSKFGEMDKILINPMTRRAKNRPFSEFVQEAFHDFQSARTTDYLEDVYGEKLHELETTYDKSVAQAIRLALSINKANLLSTEMLGNWSDVETQLIAKWFETCTLAKQHPELRTLGRKILQDSSAQIIGLVKDGQLLICVNQSVIQNFVDSSLSIMETGDTINAFTAPTENIFAYLSLPGNQKPIIVYTDGRFTDFDTKYVIQEIQGPAAAFASMSLGFGEKNTTGCNSIEEATYMGIIGFDNDSGMFKLHLKTVKGENETLSQLNQETKDRVNIEFFE